MSNWIDMQLDVLASSPDEIARIETALHRPCDKLVEWVAKRDGGDPKEIATNLKELVPFKPKRNLGFIDPSVNKARRFENDFKDRFWGVVWSHVHFVSLDFPGAVFLAQYWDDQMSYGGKVVISAGREIRCSYDGDHHAQGVEWVLPDIFAPFKTEYELGLECGTLWDEWVEGMRRQLSLLTERYPGARGLKLEQAPASGDEA